MRLIYLSILTIALSFSMNTFAVTKEVYMYKMPKAKTPELRSHGTSFYGDEVYCVQGYMFFSAGKSTSQGGISVVQMREENGKFMKCPLELPVEYREKWGEIWI